MQQIFARKRVHSAGSGIPPEEGLLIDRNARQSALAWFEIYPRIAPEGLDRAFGIIRTADIKLDYIAAGA